MGHVHSSHLDTSGIAKANCDTGFVEIFALVSLSLLVKAALLSGRDNFHVDEKKGRGIHNSSEIKKWATINGQNDLPFTNGDYDAEPVIGPGRDNVRQHNKHNVEANGASQFHDGRHGFREEGSGSFATVICHEFIERTVLPDLPTANALCAVQERAELPRRPDPPADLNCWDGNSFVILKDGRNASLIPNGLRVVQGRIHQPRRPDPPVEETNFDSQSSAMDLSVDFDEFTSVVNVQPTGKWMDNLTQTAEILRHSSISPW